MTITDSECDEVRLQMGTYVKVGNLSNEQIRTNSLLGAASDFVFAQVTTNIDITKLADYADLDELRSATVDSFLNSSALTDRQKLQFRRAVFSQTSGLAIGLLAPVVREDLNIVSRQRDIPKWQAKQVELFDRALDAIQLIRDWFPDDAFLGDDVEGLTLSFETVEAG